MHLKSLAIRLIALIIVVLMLAGGGYWLFDRFSRQPSNDHPTISSEALVARLRECADLVTVRAPVTSVIEQTDSGRLGSAKALLSITAWLDVGCDLHEAKVVSASSAAHSLHLSLPAPKVLATRLDPDRTRVHDLSRTWLWHFIPGAEIERGLINKGVQSVANGVVDHETTNSLVTLARSRIVAELKSLASGSGWDIEVDWQP